LEKVIVGGEEIAGEAIRLVSGDSVELSL